MRNSKTEKTAFKLPYAGIDHYQGLDLLYGEKGEFSVIFRINNPVLQYAADTSEYQAFHALFANLVKLLGEGFILQKQEVFMAKSFSAHYSDNFLQVKYAEHFKGREYTVLFSYLVITQMVRRGHFYAYDQKALTEFHQMVYKVKDLLESGGFRPVLLGRKQIGEYISRLLSLDFASDHPVLDNLACGETELKSGLRSIRSMSLINTDVMDLPEQVSPCRLFQLGKSGARDFPMDNFSFLFQVPGVELIVYNQVIEIPPQQLTLNKLALKRKRHSGVPDPANNLCVEDIDRLLADVARYNQLLVNAHYNIMICAQSANLAKAANFVEAALFQQGIILSRNAYNQLELFYTVLPGNTVALRKYDWFLTTSDAALCLFFKESMLKDEDSDFLIRFTDRQGVPVAIDPSDLCMRTGRINSRSRFVLGPSGSGKSFCINSLVEQYLLYNMDVVIIDTGHSYSGLCAYYGGKYITYSEDCPITMNPFVFSEQEYNIEKKDFICTLIGLCWKGAEGVLNPVERDVISSVISAYYSSYFAGSGGEQAPLGFSSFYDFALLKIPEIKSAERISFDFEEFRYVLKKFCKGGEFASVLNEQVDASLFTESFIVFEIDAIKEHKILFPLVTLVIMEVFIQKMRNRRNRRKALIVEEAWKAVSSPLMAGTLVYLYKTVRKFWGEVIVVTQELGDIIGNAVVKDSIISNSDTILLLDQSKFKDNYDQVAALLSISDTERKKIFTINQLDNRQDRGYFKEVYIRRGAYGEVYGVEVSLFQYLCYTTEKPEKTAVEHYVELEGGYQQGLEAFVRDYLASGLSLNAFVTRINMSSSPSIDHNINRN